MCVCEVRAFVIFIVAILRLDWLNQRRHSLALCQCALCVSRFWNLGFFVRVDAGFLQAVRGPPPPEPLTKRQMTILRSQRTRWKDVASRIAQQEQQRTKTNSSSACLQARGDQMLA